MTPILAMTERLEIYLIFSSEKQLIAQQSSRNSLCNRDLVAHM